MADRYVCTTYNRQHSHVINQKHIRPFTIFNNELLTIDFLGWFYECFFAFLGKYIVSFVQWQIFPKVVGSWLTVKFHFLHRWCRLSASHGNSSECTLGKKCCEAINYRYILIQRWMFQFQSDCLLKKANGFYRRKQCNGSQRRLFVACCVIQTAKAWKQHLTPHPIVRFFCCVQQEQEGSPFQLHSFWTSNTIFCFPLLCSVFDLQNEQIWEFS